MKNVSYRVSERHLIDIKQEVALCNKCDGDLKFVKPLFQDSTENVFLGYLHICKDCEACILLPFKYPRRVEIFEEDGKIVEYGNIMELFGDDEECLPIQ